MILKLFPENMFSGILLRKTFNVLFILSNILLIPF